MRRAIAAVRTNPKEALEWAFFTLIVLDLLVTLWR